MFRLQRFLSIVCFLAIAIAATALTLTHYYLEIQQLSAAGARQNQGFFNYFQESEHPLHTLVLQTAAPVGQEQPSSSEQLERLTQTLALQLRNTPMAKLKIIDLQGNSVFSSQSTEADHQQQLEALYYGALQGKIGSQLEHKDWLSASGTPIHRVIASYFPLREPQQHQIIGVVEIDSDLTPEYNAMKQQLLVLALVLIAAMVSLYAVLALIGRRAETTIRKQHRKITGQLQELNQARTLLEQRVAARTKELSCTHAELQQQFMLREQAERAAAERIRADLRAQQLLSSMLQLAMELIPVATKVERILELLIRGAVLQRAQSAAVYLSNPSEQNLYLLASSAISGADYAPSLPLGNESVQACLRSGKACYAEAEQAVAGSHAHSGQYWLPILTRQHSHQGVLIIETINNQDAEWNLEAFLQMVSHTLANLIKSDQADAQIRHLSHAMEQSHAAVVITDRNGRIEYVNKRFTALSGYAIEEARGRTPALLKSNTTLAAVYHELWQALLAGQEWRGELLNRKKNGELFWESENISPIKNDQGEITHFIAVKEDISERKHAEQQLLELATHDNLTRLPNRALLKDRLERALAQSRRNSREVALLFIDLDDFKLVNDNYGHSVGDALLKGVSQRLLTAVRETDTVGRHGGDEFMIVLTDLSSETDMLGIVDKIFATLEKPILISERAIEVHCSIGISRCPRDAGDVETLFRQADIAMYQAKEQGRNQYCLYAESMGVLLSEKASLLTDLRHALEGEELLLHYQPKIALASGQIMGSEALLRWQHPEQGMIAPGKFIPLAEESGLIIPIGQWVLERACQQQQSWVVAGLNVGPVSVNLSARQIREIDLLKVVQQALQRSGLAAEMLELEITESMMMENPEAVINTLAQVRALGVQVAIDDFGTGYSSLAYLKRFPIDRVKIDQLFVSNLVEESADAAIVNSIISMSHNLRCKVIAEGVETREQLSYLSRVGCDEIQGFYFSRPLAAEQFERLLHAGQGVNMRSGLVESNPRSSLVQASSGLTD